MSPVRQLIVVVPGIGGSVLESPDGRSAWDLGATTTRAVVGPDRLASDVDLVPRRLVDDLAILRPWLVVPGYGGLTRLLATQFGDRLRVHDHHAGSGVPPDLDVLRVPYDFRRSVADAADTLGRAVTAAVGDTGRSVVVVAHSLGGLVARYWIGAGGGWRHCRALLTLGTPHRGAPRALDWLVNGVGMGRLRLARATAVLRDWQSVHELLPQYPSVLAAHGNPVEVDALPVTAVRPFGSPDAGATLLRRAADADRVHRDIAAAWAALPEDRRPEVHPYFGRGHATPNRAVLDGDRLTVQKADPEWRPNPEWRGDGTVPALSAIPGELSHRPAAARAIPEKHGPMGCSPSVLEKLVTLQGDDLPVRGTEQHDRPWVGWDVDDTVPVATPTDVEVQLQRLHPDGAVGSAAHLLVRGGPAPLSLRMTQDGERWRTTLPPLEAGVYRLDVEVRDAWHGTSVYADTPLAVLDPQEDR